MNTNLQLLSDIDYESFYKMVIRAMNNYRFSQNIPSKGFPTWWPTRCSNLLKQKIFSEKDCQLFSNDSWLKFKRSLAKLQQLVSVLPSSVTGTRFVVIQKTLASYKRHFVNSKTAPALLLSPTFVLCMHILPGGMRPFNQNFSQIMSGLWKWI